MRRGGLHIRPPFGITETLPITNRARIPQIITRGILQTFPIFSVHSHESHTGGYVIRPYEDAVVFSNGMADAHRMYNHFSDGITDVCGTAMFFQTACPMRRGGLHIRPLFGITETLPITNRARIPRIINTWRFANISDFPMHSHESHTGGYVIRPYEDAVIFQTALLMRSCSRWHEPDAQPRAGLNRPSEILEWQWRSTIMVNVKRV